MIGAVAAPETYAPSALEPCERRARNLPFASSASSPCITWSRPWLSPSSASLRVETHFTGRPQRREAHNTNASSG